MDTCEIGIQVDLIKYRNSNSNSTSASTSDTSQIKSHHQQQHQQPSSSPGECSSSSSFARKDKCKGVNVKKLPTSSIQSDLECSLGPLDGGKNLPGHHMVDLGYESLHSTPKQVATQISSRNELIDDEPRTSSDVVDVGDVVTNHSCPPPLQSSSSVASGHRQPYLKHFKDAKMQTVDLEDSNGDTDDMSNMSYDTSSVKWTEELTSKLRNSSLIRKFRLCSGGHEHSDNCNTHQCSQNNGAQGGKSNESNKINSSVVLTSKGTLTTNGVDDEEMDIEDGSSVKQMDHGSIASDFEPRIEWNKKMDFLLSIIGFAVDLANVWRFPYLCYKNGGGVFLIPYTIMLLFGALPLFFMELALGQFAKSGPIALWSKICPVMKGVGYCCVLISWYVSFYYNVIIGWTLYFIATTLTSGSRLPWQHCDNEWNTARCYSLTEVMTANSTVAYENRSSPAQEFFERRVLQIDHSTGLTDMGNLRPELVVCCFIVFIMLYFSLFKGVKSSGKVVWVTATAPYFILTILLIRGLFLPGAGTGILYYLNPRMEKLLEPNVWIDAAVQVFFSIGVGFGVHLTYASFNKFNNNCYADALLTCCVNSLTSFYSGFVIFTFLGYMAVGMKKDIENVASEGYGLVFQVYPEAISTLPFAQLWCLLFFIMLVTLGLDSAMGGLEAVITGLMDEFNFKNIKREYFTAIVISTSFFGSLINCTQGGGYAMYWFDNYSAGISLLCSALFEALALRIYGLDKFIDDIESMLGFRPNVYWVICWKYISPVFLLCVVISAIATTESLTFHNYTYPSWSTILGWILALSSVAAIPVFALIHWIKLKYFPNLIPPPTRRRSSHGSQLQYKVQQTHPHKLPQQQQSHQLHRHQQQQQQQPQQSPSASNCHETGSNFDSAIGQVISIKDPVTSNAIFV